MKKVCHKYLKFVNGLFLNPGRSLKTAALLMAAGFAVVACRVDEQFEEPQEDGLPAAVSVRLSLPDMTVQTRSLTDDQASAVNHIWLGIYDAASGRLKGSFEKAVSHEDRHVLHQLDNITSSSGNSYIVAVANARDNYGMSSMIKVDEVDASGRANLLELLHNADTWEKYRSIAVALQNTSVVEYTEANVVMTGSYTSATGINANHPLGPDVETVYLKGGNNILTGRIHLRRVISQVTFNITAGEGITIRPTSWRVVNNPRLSFLQERLDNNVDGLTNAGDVITAHLDDADPNANYGASHPETEIEGSSTAGYSFSFYTYENKRTGTAADYDEREREHKHPDGSNTGIYVALCGENTASPNVKNGVNLNNFATYVEITCEVNYTITDAEDETRKIQRTGTAVYTVHLGYVNGAGDFNVRRNYKYTYNMQVLGLNQIVIEAETVETRPGIEGDVIDATQSIVTVDAHYGVYNIQLSNAERARLHYYMEAPYGGEVKVVQGGYEKGVRLPTPNPGNPYYNWIRIKPTSGERIFAEYKSSTTDEPWYLDDLVGVDANHRGYGDNTGSLTDNTQRWYTVFINEYVYEGTYDGVTHGLSDWVNFVNQDMRTVLFLVQDIAVSDDTESRYSQGKYLLRQRSIQTYYSTDPAVIGENPTALGAEHINESYGKRIDWRWAATTSSPDGTSFANTVLSNRNGRWNLWKFLNNATNAQSNNGITNTTATRSWVCANAMDNDTRRDGSWGVMRYVNAAGTDQNNRNSHYMRANYEGYAVPEIAHYTAASNSTDRNQDPQNVARYYEAVALCMSRNRDLNGNGSIEPNEVRWYLPAEGKYERLMLGRNSLVTPLFSTSNGSYYTNSADDIAVSKNNYGFNGKIVGYGADNQIQYISSDHYKFYTEEGGSYNPDIRIYWIPGDDGTYYGRYPWNIRCVRNLGVSMETVTQDPNADPVEKAYSYDAANREFDMTHYFGNSLRANISTYMEVHTLTDLDKNKTPRKLKVSSTHASYTLGTTVNEQSYSTVKDALDANYPCANYSETGDGGATWRAPNQRELMMMVNEQLLNTSGLVTFSCTMESYGTKSRYACSEGSAKYMFMNRNLPSSGGSFSVRCVRDIE